MIRWPWVSRVRYDAERKNVDALYSRNDALVRRADTAEHSAAQWQSVVKTLEQMFDEEKARCERYDTRYADLLSRYHMLKLQGFSEPVAPVARPQVQPDPIKRAIAQRAGTNRALRENMERQVAQDRLLGKSDEEILSAIIAGVSGETLILSEAGLMSP